MSIIDYSASRYGFGLQPNIYSQQINTPHRNPLFRQSCQASRDTTKMNTNPRRLFHSLMDRTFQLHSFDIVRREALCSHCRVLSAAVMASADGQPHAESIEALRRSAQECPLCNILYADSFDEVKSQLELPGISPAVCRIGLCGPISRIYLTFGGRLEHRGSPNVQNRVYAKQGRSCNASIVFQR
jgi:hypothetical protein